MVWEEDPPFCIIRAVRNGGRGDKNEEMGKESSGKLDPNAIAETYWNLAQQPKSCWTFELDVRPSVENW